MSQTEKDNATAYSNKKELPAEAEENAVAVVGRVDPSYYQYKALPNTDPEEKDWVLIDDPGDNVTIKYRELSIAALKSSAISPAVGEYAGAGFHDGRSVRVLPGL